MFTSFFQWVSPSLFYPLPLTHPLSIPPPFPPPSSVCFSFPSLPLFFSLLSLPPSLPPSLLSSPLPKLPSRASNPSLVTESPVHQAPGHYPGQKSVSPFSLMYCQRSLANLPTSHDSHPVILCRQNPFRGPPEAPLRQGRSQDGWIKPC